MQCPRCQQENPTGHKFCRECGTPLARLEGGAQPALSYAEVEHFLTEALEQQTATSEILRVISSSPSDIQPVFDAIAANAARLCDAVNALVHRFDGQLLHLAAHHNVDPDRLAAVRQAYPRPPSRGTLAGRSILTRAVVHVPDVSKDPEYTLPVATTIGYRSVLAVPMIHEGVPRGTIVVARDVVAPFSDTHIALLQTFADQAVIAIENARLFNETTEALEQQMATSEILRTISRSPTELGPVLDGVAENAARLCEARDIGVFQLDGDTLRAGATYGTGPRQDIGSIVRIRRDLLLGRTLLERRTIHVHDMVAELETEYPGMRSTVERFGMRTMLCTPLLSGGNAVGVVVAVRYEVRPFSDKHIQLLETFADQTVIAIENVRLFTELQEKNRALTEAHDRVSEALEQQTATSEILRVISQSPTDTRPVFDAIVERALRLSEATVGAVTVFDGELIHVVASNLRPDSPILRVFPMRPGRTGSLAARTVFERQIIHVPDALAEPEYNVSQEAAESGYRNVLSVPMLRDGTVVGTITVGRSEAGRYLDRQIALLQTFADQAVIAIENVRLFKELETRNKQLTEALEQQVATSEILRVISSSPTDIQPVLDTVVESAVRLCGAERAVIFRFDGKLLRAAASYKVGTELRQFVDQNPIDLGQRSISARAGRERRTVHIPDLQADPASAYAMRDVQPIRTMLAVPMLKGDDLVGTITMYRLETDPFTDKQVALVETFADQAVIAIENVRLFTELEARNGDLAESLEQQTATAEVLRVISSSPTDLQPVFDAISERAMRLCGASVSSVLRFDGELVYIVALANVSPDGAAALRSGFPMPPSSRSASARAILMRDIVHLPDIFDDPEYGIAALSQPAGFRSILSVPMLREGDAIGGITVGRPDPGRFSDRQITLLKGFADQAVIAVENVRLFKELELRNRDLTEALEQQTATSELLKVIGRSALDLQPVFDMLAESAVRLCQAERGGIFRFDGRLLRLVAGYNISPELWAFIEQNPPEPGRHTATARAAFERRTIHIHDVLDDPEYTYGVTQVDPVRTVLTVPLLRAGDLLGVINIYRFEVRPFSESQIALLQTFADQAVIAIENVRLFKELEARTAELTRSVEELTALGEVSQALSSTLDIETVLDTIVSRASQLVGDAGCSIYEYDEATEHFELRATHHYDADFVEALRAAPLRKGEGVMGRAAEMREPIQIPDITQPGAYQSSVRDTLIRFGYRALLSVPLLREDQIIGSLSFNRKAPGEFPSEVVDVLKTFATQSALAIQNARLFREIADKSRQLETASRHKSEFLANMSHELRTPLNAILGFSEVLAQGMFGEINEKQSEYLHDILESGRHLLSLINDILDLSKIEAGRMELEATDFDLPQAIQNALTLVRERALRRGIALHHVIDARVADIRADERKVKQVLLNLLSNAIKFTPEGGRIAVRAAPADGLVEVSVADTGIGIAPGDQETVFEEFRQVGTADRKAEGTGLGLALSRKFIELHGGRIRVTSQVGVGSTFTFTLPVR